MTVRVSRSTYEQMAGCKLPASKSGPRQPNRTEARYRDEVLVPGTACGRNLGFKYESLKLRIGERCWFTCDWVVFMLDGRVELHEVKGFWRNVGRPGVKDDAMVKLRAIANMYPFRVVMVWKEGGAWCEKEIR